MSPSRRRALREQHGAAPQIVTMPTSAQPVSMPAPSRAPAKVASRPGGYTRVIKLGQRRGDGAHVAMIELVDYALGMDAPAEPVKKKQDRRSRVNQKKKAKSEPAAEAGVTASA